MKHLVVVAFATIALLGTSSAHAQDKSEKSEKSEAKGTEVRMVEDKMADKEELGDPSRMICRKVGETGSRLRARRVCATAAEWAVQKAQNRQAIEKTQTQGYGRSGG